MKRTMPKMNELSVSAVQILDIWKIGHAYDVLPKISMRLAEYLVTNISVSFYLSEHSRIKVVFWADKVYVVRDWVDKVRLRVPGPSELYYTTKLLLFEFELKGWQFD